MNIVLDEAFEEKAGGEKVSIGMIVCTNLPCISYEIWDIEYRWTIANDIIYQVIRGNSVVMLEALERISDK